MRILAVSMESPDLAQAMAKRTNATFEFFSDESYTLIDYFGVRHKGGGPGGDIARSASFLIDQNGKVLWQFATDNYRVRPKPGEILEEIDKLSAR